MYKKALEVLNILANNGYVAYIVGGYPRDYLLNIKSTDIDICTNAKPVELSAIFDTDKINDIGYGAIKIIYKNYRFDITTFRKDIKYEDNRRPIKIKYINDLKKDLLRRDFTINTLCIDKDGNLIDLLNAKGDIDNKIIKTVGNPRYRIKEDSLRILRAIRFASILDFDIDIKTKNYIYKYGYLLKGLSCSRRKEELNKIFSSTNKEKGIKLIIELSLDKYLGINNLDKAVLCDDIIGIWSQLDIIDDYPFTKVEKETIKNIRLMLQEGINSYTVYKYGLYVSTVVGSIKGISYRKINKIYRDLLIYSKKDIAINGMDICNALNKKPGNYLSEIINDIEKLIVTGKLMNNRDIILEYVSKRYWWGDIMGILNKIKNAFSTKKELEQVENYDKGLKKSREEFVSQLSNLSKKYKNINDDYFEDLENILIMADIGVNTVISFVDRLRHRVKSEKITDSNTLKEIIVDELFVMYVGNNVIDCKLKLASDSPTVILFVGVNGVGKTTTIGKLALKYKNMGKKVLLCAGDTFRAGAVEQLVEWGHRTDTFVVTGASKDPSSVVYDSLELAKKENYDIVLIDTAGRLQNKANLMEELAKINRVIKKIIPGAPHETLLVIDATTGQNGINQAKAFKEITDITGIILTKLDGTAKGGIVLAIKEEINIPVKFVGLGEDVTQLETFDIEKYIYGLFKDL